MKSYVNNSENIFNIIFDGKKLVSRILVIIVDLQILFVNCMMWLKQVFKLNI